MSVLFYFCCLSRGYLNQRLGVYNTFHEHERETPKSPESDNEYKKLGERYLELFNTSLADRRCVRKGYAALASIYYSAHHYSNFKTLEKALENNLVATTMVQSHPYFLHYLRISMQCPKAVNLIQAYPRVDFEDFANLSEADKNESTLSRRDVAIHFDCIAKIYLETGKYAEAERFALLGAKCQVKREHNLLLQSLIKARQEDMEGSERLFAESLPLLEEKVKLQKAEPVLYSNYYWTLADTELLDLLVLEMSKLQTPLPHSSAVRAALSKLVLKL